jgi:hypothetical protein
VRYPNAKESVSKAIKDARDNPDRLLMSADPKREPRSFRVSVSKELGAKRGRGQGSFVLESKNHANEFYRQVLQQLRAWSASAPKLPEPETATLPSDASPEPPPFIAPEREFGEARD